MAMDANRKRNAGEVLVMVWVVRIDDEYHSIGKNWIVNKYLLHLVGVHYCNYFGGITTNFSSSEWLGRDDEMIFLRNFTI